MTEQWLPVVDWEGWYEVSDHGRVRSVPREIVRLNRWGQHALVRFAGKVLALRPDPKGHLRITLSRPGYQDERMVHHLVLEMFVGPRPEGMHGLHWDDDKDNNRLVNLRWGTRSDNSRDAIRNGRHNHADKTHCINGHEFTAENTYSRSLHRNWRGCRACRLASGRAFRESRAASKEGVNA